MPRPPVKTSTHPGMKHTAPENKPTVISADGKCESPPAGLEEREHIEIIIDATRLTGGETASTLLGTTRDHLPASIHYTLEQLEPMENGRCLARYRRSPGQV